MLELAAPEFCSRVDCIRLAIGYYENLLRSLKHAIRRSPALFLSAGILCIAEVSEISVRETIQRLMDAGLQSIPGEARRFSTTKSAQRLPV